MKLLTFKKPLGYGLGVILNDYILDLNQALDPELDMLTFLDLGNKGMKMVEEQLEKSKNDLERHKKTYLSEKAEIKITAPIPRPRKNIVCLGLNYAEHVKEGASGSSRPLPQHPIYFTKPPTSIIGPYDPVLYHPAISRLDYEVELAFIIGKKGKNILKKDAFDYVAGFTVLQDISARQIQSQHVQWFRGKSFDSFAPMGPYLVTKDEVSNPDNLDIWCKVNGEIRQKANTRDLIFDIPTIISTLSDGITLEPGDIFATGTPSGVGAAHPLGLLKVGDIIESGINGIGVMKNKVIS